MYSFTKASETFYLLVFMTFLINWGFLIICIYRNMKKHYGIEAYTSDNREIVLQRDIKIKYHQKSDWNDDKAITPF